MVQRFAAVIWWLGLLLLLGSVVGVFATLQADVRQKEEGFILSGLGALATAGLWSLSFVLGGSFLRPPRQQ